MDSIVAIHVKSTLFICFLFSMGTLMAEKKDYSKEERAIINRSVGEVVDLLEKEMKEQYGLLCIGQGGGMPYDIEEIEVDFVYHHQVTIEEARELEIKSTERFVQIINNHEAIRPYLKNYPWDFHRAQVMISFRDNYGIDYPAGIRLILQARDNIVYFGPKKSLSDIEPIKREPYAEAKQIVNSSPSCLKPLEPPQKKKWFNWL